MQIYIILALLPCIWADDVKTITCPDGNICPVGETCCKNSTHYDCCDLVESERNNKKLVPAILQSYGDLNVSSASNCSDTLCGSEWCCPLPTAACCPGSSCCPSDSHCCGKIYPDEWCCKTKQRCAESYMYCIAGATAVSPPFAALLVIFLGIVLSKQF